MQGSTTVVVFGLINRLTSLLHYKMVEKSLVNGIRGLLWKQIWKSGWCVLSGCTYVVKKAGDFSRTLPRIIPLQSHKAVMQTRDIYPPLTANLHSHNASWGWPTVKSRAWLLAKEAVINWAKVRLRRALLFILSTEMSFNSYFCEKMTLWVPKVIWYINIKYYCYSLVHC